MMSGLHDIRRPIPQRIARRAPNTPPNCSSRTFPARSAEDLDPPIPSPDQDE